MLLWESSPSFLHKTMLLLVQLCFHFLLVLEFIFPKAYLEPEYSNSLTLLLYSDIFALFPLVISIFIFPLVHNYDLHSSNIHAIGTCLQLFNTLMQE